VGNVAGMFESPAVERYYPDLSMPLEGKFGNSKGSAHINEIEEDLGDARRQLEASSENANELQLNIANLEFLVSLVWPSEEPPKLTLHEAMKVVLEVQPGKVMRVSQLADEINTKHLYTRRDHKPIEPRQLEARAHQYPDMLERSGGFIRLVQLRRVSSDPLQQRAHYG
jgi:hypothetical protein